MTQPRAGSAHNSHPPEFWETIAQDYRDEVTARGGLLRGVVKTLAERRGCTPDTMSVWIREARKYGYLEPYAYRACYNCGQPVARSVDGELLVMEVNALEYADRCKTRGYEKAARLFAVAAKELEFVSKRETA